MKSKSEKNSFLGGFPFFVYFQFEGVLLFQQILTILLTFVYKIINGSTTQYSLLLFHVLVRIPILFPYRSFQNFEIEPKSF